MHALFYSLSTASTFRYLRLAARFPTSSTMLASKSFAGLARGAALRNSFQVGSPFSPRVELRALTARSLY